MSGDVIIIGHYLSEDGDLISAVTGPAEWIVKLSDGFITDVPNFLLSEFDFSIYPSPTIGEVKVSFTLDKSSEVKLEVLNSLGQRVKSISKEKLSPGKNKIIFSTSDFSEGIYHLRFSVDGSFVTKKLVKM